MDIVEQQQIDQGWMEQALDLARHAEHIGEVPVGAILVRDGEILGKGWNNNIESNDPSAHAEMMAMRKAGSTVRNHRLPGCTLYVTLEPCVMCAGAIIHARLDRLVYGASDPKTGAAGGRFDVLGDKGHNHRVQVHGECLASESADLLKSFFRRKRQA